MNKEKVLLINTNLMKPVVAPIGLDYLAQAIEKNGFSFDILDLAFSSDIKKDIDDYLKNNTNYFAIGITIRNIDDSYFLSQDFCLEKCKEIIDYIKTKTDVPLILGGVGFSIIPIAILKYCNVEFGIISEGEFSFPLLLKRIKNNKSYHDVPNLIFKTDTGYFSTSTYYLNLEQISLARRDAIDNLKYYQEGGMVGFETKRGCDQGCSYCADPIAKGNKIRCRNPVDVALELKNLVEKGIYHFHTCDSEFNIPIDHAIAVCKEIVNLKLENKLQWYAYASPAPFSEELAYWMKKAGCVGINFGADSGNDNVLKILNRKHLKSDLENVATICRKYGFAFMFDLLIGGPGETRNTVKETIEFVKKLEPDCVGISLGIRLYPDTPLVNKIATQEQISVENKNLHGFVESNKEMLKPIYYLSYELGQDIEEYLRSLIAGDNRFFFGSSEQIDSNYNYNENSQLMQAIREGYRGAFWDILRKLRSQS